MPSPAQGRERLLDLDVKPNCGIRKGDGEAINRLDRRVQGAFGSPLGGRARLGFSFRVGLLRQRVADSINAPRRFTDALPGGTEIRILENRGGWFQIELHNGRNAWVTASSVARIAP